MVMREAVVDKIELPIELSWQFADVSLDESRVVEPSCPRGAIRAHCHSCREVNPYNLAVRHARSQTSQFAAWPAARIEDPCVGRQQRPKYEERFVEDGSGEWPDVRVVRLRQAVEFRNQVIMLGGMAE
jgi:hypothetical protein